MSQTPEQIARLSENADEILVALSNLQAWCCLMSRKDSGSLSAADLIQRTRILIIEYRAILKEQSE